jgi:hypothetical protein
MRTNARRRIAWIVAGSVMAIGLGTAPAADLPAGTWTVAGTTTARYRYDGRQGRLDSPFSTRIVVHEDGSIDGEVIEPRCDPAGDPVGFQGRRSGGFAPALRAFTTRCYGTKARVAGVRGAIRLSADATSFAGEFRARLRIPYVEGDEIEFIAVRLRGVVEGRRGE